MLYWIGEKVCTIQFYRILKQICLFENDSHIGQFLHVTVISLQSHLWLLTFLLTFAETKEQHVSLVSFLYQCLSAPPVCVAVNDKWFFFISFYGRSLCSIGRGCSSLRKARQGWREVERWTLIGHLEKKRGCNV